MKHSKTVRKIASLSKAGSKTKVLISKTQPVSLSSTSVVCSQRNSYHTSRITYAEKVIDAELSDADFASKPQESSSATPGVSTATGTHTVAEDVETVTGSADKHEFKAETRRLLEIVARSLYTDKEVFIRELISNASDALSKVSYRQLTNQPVESSSADLEISIQTDEKRDLLIIQDYGIGMTKQELIENIGTIAHSGTKEFFKKLETSKEQDLATLIGQFGVGFYSVFVVAKQVKLYTKSAVPGSPGYCWISDGHGSYQIYEADNVQRGTKIIIELDTNAKEYAKPQNVENIIKKHSNFVGYPIRLNGEKLNTLRPLWQVPRDSITEEEHKKFYQFLSHSYDSPTYHLHFAADAPLSIRSVFYVPEQHSEKYGMGRMEPGVNLFSKKILVKAKIKELLPDWLRFIKGVVDCEDIPLHLSREHLQDTELIKRLGGVLTGRILRMFRDEAKKDLKKYLKFWREFNQFFKEGICTDAKWKEELGQLLRFDSSSTEGEADLTSLDEYIARAKPGQNEIYYLCAPSKSIALMSPYYEVFKKKGYEVLFLYASIDDFVMSTLGEYSGKKLSSIESTDVSDTKKENDPTKEGDAQEKPSSKSELKGEDLTEFLKWMKTSLGEKVSVVKTTNRLESFPAVIEDHESANMRKMMKYIDPTRMPKLPRQRLDINPKHPIILKLDDLRRVGSPLAGLVADQVFDDALIAVGLMDDPRAMLPRLNQILEAALSGASKSPSTPSSSSSTSSSSTSSSSTSSSSSTPQEEKKEVLESEVVEEKNS